MVLNGVPGHYLGIDLVNRIGMPDLWFRSPTRDLQGKDEFDYWVMNSLGASVSMLGDAWRGISLMREGNYERGVEALVPKWARDLIRAQRYASEGLTNIRGDQVLADDAMSAWDVIAQAVGFTPAKVSEAWERNSALTNAERRVLAKRRQAREPLRAGAAVRRRGRPSRRAGRHRPLQCCAAAPRPRHHARHAPPVAQGACAQCGEARGRRADREPAGSAMVCARSAGARLSRIARDGREPRPSRRYAPPRYARKLVAGAGFHLCPNFSGPLPVFGFHEVEDAEQLAA